MRLLHLSDLHAGKTLGSVSRNEDLAYALEQVLNFCKGNKVDLLLIAGDIFDKANPDNESKEIVFDFFLRLNELKIPAVAISGNHDSYEFMKSLRKLLRVINVFVFPKPDLENAVFSFGELKIACLPYPSERVITKAEESAKLDYAIAVEKAIKYLYKQVEEAKFKVLLTHLFLAGAKYTKTEREATISKFYAVEPSSIPEGFDYVALGHVHRYQRIEKAPTYAYYTGSLYQLDFSETGQEKFFNFVELREDSPPLIEAVRLTLKYPLHVVEVDQNSYAKDLEEAKTLNGYLRVNLLVRDKNRLNFVVDRIKEVLGDRLIRIELITEELRAQEKEGVQELQALNVIELYREYFKETYNREPEERVIKTVLSLMESVRNESGKQDYP